MYAELIPVILPVLACVAVGFAWARSSVPFEREFVTRIVMNVGAPCLLLHIIDQLDTEAVSFGMMVIIALTLILITGSIGALVLRVSRQPLLSYVPPVAFANIGNLGLPLCYFAFGDEGLLLGMGFYLTGTIVQFAGAPMIQGRRPPWATLVRTPIIYAAALGLVLLSADLNLPLSIANTVELLGGMSIPLMILAMGYSLGSFRVQRMPVAFGLSVLRLGLGFSAGIAIVEFLGLEGAARGVVIIESAMPVAVFNYLIAARYGRHAEDVAGAIVVSTLISLLTLPLLIGFALREAG